MSPSLLVTPPPCSLCVPPSAAVFPKLGMLMVVVVVVEVVAVVVTATEAESGEMAASCRFAVERGMVVNQGVDEDEREASLVE